MDDILWVRETNQIEVPGAIFMYAVLLIYAVEHCYIKYTTSNILQ